ncbi:MAG TPA: hypothetical protein VFE33_17115 [Thermoanaerobaculia bacterium]|nr:hypothetical protein [Thermoanaerobaculia bacterium]
MARFTLGLRASAALLIFTLLLLLRVPVCASPACPMGGMARTACRTMGMDCCQGTGVRAAHAPAPLPDVAVTPPLHAALPTATGAMAAGPSHRPLAAPAVLQGVGLFTLFAVFLI